MGWEWCGTLITSEMSCYGQEKKGETIGKPNQNRVRFCVVQDRVILVTRIHQYPIELV